MKTADYKETLDQYYVHVYNRFPIVLERGDGMRVYDTDGKEYLDFAAGIAVFALGYNDPEYNAALTDQIGKIIHTSNLYYNVPAAEASEKLVRSCGMSKAFFTNSGTEAIEGAIKAARKYAWKKGKKEGGIIAMKNSFHGRSVGALSVTGNDHYQEAFRPLMGGVKFARFNDFDSILECVGDDTCAIILETVQGEGGIYPADPAFLRDVRALCDEKDILLILDEIQCGMGRTGDLWAFDGYGIKPDIMTCAKALGCGVPVGAFVLNEKTASSSLEPGDHGTTYGGNPLACAAVSAVFDIFEKRDIVGHVRELTPYFERKLGELTDRHSCVKERRGKGFMQGLELEGRKVGEVVAAAREKGLLVISAGTNVLRLVPPLAAQKEDFDKMAEILDVCLG